MDKIKNLLNQVEIINKKNAEILDATGGRFNMFRICGVKHYENTHSAIIAEFLNPTGTHGLKSKLLQCFIETLGENFTIQNFNSEKSRVHLEYSTKDGRIDIMIEDNQNKAIIIENKIYAKEQPKQLIRYDKHAQTYIKDYQILYLTLWGNNASEQSGGGVSYLSISYKEHIINWLEKCVGISSRFPMVRETIIQYINHLKQLTNQDMATRNKEEITEVLSKIENLKAAKAIYDNFNSVYEYLIENNFNPKMTEFAKQNGLEYHYDGCQESYVTFNFTKPNWHEKFHIRFTVEPNLYFYGLSYNDIDSYTFSENDIQIIHKNLIDLDIVYCDRDEWWPFFSCLEFLTFDIWENDIVKNEHFINECKEKVSKILKAVEEIEV